MEAVGFHLTLLVTLFLLLVAPAAVFHIVPSKLQLFEYESVSFTCLGFNVSAGFKVMNMKESIPCSDSSCTIKFSLVTDSGEYWCEGGGERSRSVSITVTAGPVVLESPVRPVMEGDHVTLSCRSKMASSNLTAHFYKDGVLLRSSSTGNMSLHSVSKSEEGLYKCGTGAGESAESPLTLTALAVILEAPVRPVTQGEAASLRCRLSSSPSDVPAVFYKDDVFIGTSSTGNLSLLRVSKTHEGLYRCNVSGAGQSEGQRLVVTDSEQTQAACLCSDHVFYYLHLVRAASTVVMVILMLLLTRLHCGKLGQKAK